MANQYSNRAGWDDPIERQKLLERHGEDVTRAVEREVFAIQAEIRHHYPQCEWIELQPIAGKSPYLDDEILAEGAVQPTKKHENKME